MKGLIALTFNKIELEITKEKEARGLSDMFECLLLIKEKGLVFVDPKHPFTASIQVKWNGC